MLRRFAFAVDIELGVRRESHVEPWVLGCRVVCRILQVKTLEKGEGLKGEGEGTIHANNDF